MSPKSQPVRMPPWDRQAWVCVLVAAAVLLPRAWLITAAHSETHDADPHLRRGLATLLGTRHEFIMGANDAPLGQMILALPMALTGASPEKPVNPANWPPGVSVPGERPAGEPPASPQRARYERLIRHGVLYGNSWSAPALLTLIGLWKSALLVPVLALIFQWCRAVYGLPAAWLSLALILIEPTFAAHVPVVALDTLAVGAIVVACFCTWRYFERPTTAGLVLASFTTAAAILIKHTAVIMPAVFLLYAARYWIWLPWCEGVTGLDWSSNGRARMRVLMTALLVGLLSVWVLLKFDVSVPADQMVDTPPGRPTSRVGEILDTLLHQRWPGGTYIGCFASGFLTNAGGQRSLLFGRISQNGHWYYFPALMTIKVPIGIGIVLIVALVSLMRKPIHPGEFSILLPLGAWTIFLLGARMNTGFRHFLPAYVFLLMWAGRAALALGRAGAIAAWTGVVAAAAHVLTFHPDYLSYVNLPRRQVWTQMTDSNLDWGQGLKEVGRWLDEHPQPPGKPVHVLTRLGVPFYDGPWYLDDRADLMSRSQAPPKSGLLIISPVWVAGVYDDPGANPYAFLQPRQPLAIIGHAMLVYDLD